MGILRVFIDLNKAISCGFDRLIGAGFTRFGSAEFDAHLMPAYLKDGQTAFDIGGGKNPNIDAEVKAKKNLRVIGIDIAEDELRAAPKDLYDEIHVCNISSDVPPLEEKADVIICRALLEHVENTEDAIGNMAALLKPGGHILIFVPCKNALYTRLNLLLSEEMKVKLLRMTFPEKMHRLGFKAYYDRTTPGAFEKIARRQNLELVETNIYWASRYFEVLFPVYILWRIYQMILKLFGLRNFCETFTMVLRKD